MNLYREKILEIYKNPQHFDEIDDFNFQAEKENLFCGDRLKVKIKLKENLIEKIAFSGEGCVLTIVGASAAGDLAKGSNLERIKKLSLKDILKKLGLEEILPSREKCLTLGLSVIKEALHLKEN